MFLNQTVLADDQRPRRPASARRQAPHRRVAFDVGRSNIRNPSPRPAGPNFQRRLPDADPAASQANQPSQLDPGEHEMNLRPQRLQAAAAISDAIDGGRGLQARRGPDGGHKALLGVIERDPVQIIRAGKLREAMATEGKKTDLSRRYVHAVGRLKASQKYLAQVAPELLTTLHRHHDVFRAMLQVNLTVLATAHAVSEGTVWRQRRDAAPQPAQHLRTLGRTARGAATAAHITPIFVSRLALTPTFLIKLSRRCQRPIQCIL